MRAMRPELLIGAACNLQRLMFGAVRCQSLAANTSAIADSSDAACRALAGLCSCSNVLALYILNGQHPALPITCPPWDMQRRAMHAAAISNHRLPLSGLDASLHLVTTACSLARSPDSTIRPASGREEQRCTDAAVRAADQAMEELLLEEAAESAGATPSRRSGALHSRGAAAGHAAAAAGQGGMIAGHSGGVDTPQQRAQLRCNLTATCHC